MTNVFKEEVLFYCNAIETRWHDKTNEIYSISFRVLRGFAFTSFCPLVEKAGWDARSIQILSAPLIMPRSIILFAGGKTPFAAALIA